MQALWPNLDNTKRGKVVASPKFGPWWILWIHVCSWLVRAPKVLLLCINQLVVWFVWIIDPLVIHPNPHLRVPTCPFTLKVLWTKEWTPTPYPSIVFTFRFTIESTKKIGGAFWNLDHMAPKSRRWCGT